MLYHLWLLMQGFEGPKHTLVWAAARPIALPRRVLGANAVMLISRRAGSGYRLQAIEVIQIPPQNLKLANGLESGTKCLAARLNYQASKLVARSSHDVEKTRGPENKAEID